MKYPFNVVKMINKFVNLTAPLADVKGYCVDINSHNFICESVDDQVCHSVSLTIHHNIDIVFQASVNNWSDPKKNRQIFKEVKTFVASQNI